MENRSEPQISSLVWQKFEHPAHMFLGHSGEDVNKMDNVEIDRHLLRLMSPPRWQHINKFLFPKTVPNNFRSSSYLRRAAKRLISFITVRHPFERLLSAYRDRFFATDSSEYEVNKAALYRRRYGLEIIRKHRLKTHSMLLSESVIIQIEGLNHSQATQFTAQLRHSKSLFRTC